VIYPCSVLGKDRKALEANFIRTAVNDLKEIQKILGNAERGTILSLESAIWVTHVGGIE